MNSKAHEMEDNTFQKALSQKSWSFLVRLRDLCGVDFSSEGDKTPPCERRREDSSMSDKRLQLSGTRAKLGGGGREETKMSRLTRRHNSI
jgi:hypothetical protein